MVFHSSPTARPEEPPRRGEADNPKVVDAGSEKELEAVGRLCAYCGFRCLAARGGACECLSRATAMPEAKGQPEELGDHWLPAKGIAEEAGIVEPAARTPGGKPSYSPEAGPPGASLSQSSGSGVVDQAIGLLAAEMAKHAAAAEERAVQRDELTARRNEALIADLAEKWRESRRDSRL